MPSLVNRRLFITGMGSGIGLATARLAIAEGAQVSGTIQTAGQLANLEDIASPDTCFQIDVTDEAALTTAVADAAERLGGLDGTVACAGIIKLLTSSDTGRAEWSRIIDVNLTAGFTLARAATPFLTAEDHASMVFISSQIGLVGHQRAAAYAADQWACQIAGAGTSRPECAGERGRAGPDCHRYDRRHKGRPGPVRGAARRDPDGPVRHCRRDCKSGSLPAVRQGRLHHRSGGGR